MELNVLFEVFSQAQKLFLDIQKKDPLVPFHQLTNRIIQAFKAP